MDGISSSILDILWRDNVNDLLNWLLHLASLVLDPRDLHDLLALVRNVDVDVVVDVHVVVTVLLRDLRNMHNLLLRHWDWHVNELVDVLLRDTLLSDDLRHVDDRPSKSLD